MEEKFGRALRDGLKFSFEPEFQIESYLRHQGREIRRVLRREHVPSHHQGARLLRSGHVDRRQPRAGAGAGDVPVSRRLVHHRLAVRAGALARDREGARRQRPRRFVRGDRRGSRARRVPARRARSTWRSCARIASASSRSAKPTRAPPACAAPEVRATGPESMAAPYVPSAAAAAGRADFATIAAWIARGSHVLDLGCGDGSLLAYLARERGTTGYGIEIDDAGVHASVRERHQCPAERPRDGARRVRRCVVRLRDPVADAAGDAPRRRDRRPRCCASGARRSSRSRTSGTGRIDGRSRTVGCPSPRRCRTSGTTRRTSTFAPSPISMRSSRAALARHEPRRARGRAAGVDVLPNLLGELAIYRFRRA